MILFAFSPILLQMLSRFLRIGFMRDVLIQVRCLAYEKIMNLSIEDYRSQAKENYMALVVSDINVFEKDFFLSILNIIFSFGSFIVGILIMFFISPFIAISTVAASSLLFIVTRIYEKPTRNIKEKTQEANAEYTIQLSNILNGLEVIKLYQVESNFRHLFIQLFQNLKV
jgi:ABC-type multidrug transport system fused ATPase/permease subunit